ncbi:MAG: class I SAM-dependent methyltransferase family protein [archaeon]|nr:MAG: class I SAM-dependent methyltransferase family protein [archaeon]
MNLKDALEGRLTAKETEKLGTSFDIVGSREKAVAIIEVPEELRKKEKIIGEALLRVHKNVVSVLRKSSERRGEFRLREYRLIAGSRNTEVLHRESGCRFLLDPRKTYFSVREGTERERIAKQVKDGEKILVMFGGVAPFAIVIAKNKDTRIYSVEINPEAHKYACENVLLNRVGNRVVPVLGDVREVCKILGQKFDRILMPLPEKAWSFLDMALPCSKPGGVIYLYGFEDKGSKDLEKKAKTAAKKTKTKIRILRKRKVLPYGPGTFKVCLEIKVS